MTNLERCISPSAKSTDASLITPKWELKIKEFTRYNSAVERNGEAAGEVEVGPGLMPAARMRKDDRPSETTTVKPDTNKQIDYCNTSVDAIIEVRGLELYIFKGEYQWRVTWSKTVSNWISYQLRDGPTKIAYYWNVLPPDVDFIDAAVERPDSLIYIFRGNKFWLLADNKQLAGGCPRSGMPLTRLGLPEGLKKVDAVFKWDVNQAFYIFAGDRYWLLDVKAHPPFGKVAPSPDYPRPIKDTWRGIPTPVTTAYTTLNGETLFFDGSKYYVFDNTAMQARKGYPKPAKLGIIGCQDT